MGRSIAERWNERNQESEMERNNEGEMKGICETEGWSMVESDNERS